MSVHVIGHVCSRGHYDFRADPEFDQACGSKWAGTIKVEFDDEMWPEDHADLISECDEHLNRVIATWRNS